LENADFSQKQYTMSHWLSTLAIDYSLQVFTF